MSYFHALLLGIVQGIGEFCPISSSSHLVIIKKIFNINSVPLLFDTFLHCITLIIICIVLRKTITLMISSLISKYFYQIELNQEEDSLSKQAIIIVIASIITILIFFLLDKFIINITKTNLTKQALGFIYTAIILIASQFLACKNPLSVTKQALIIGIFQSLAILPGISRSGSTIFAYLLCGYTIKKAVMYSFLLSIPITIGAFLYSLKDLDSLSNSIEIRPMILAGITTFLLGIPTLKVFLKTVTKAKRLYPFAFYLLVIALLIFISHIKT